MPLLDTAVDAALNADFVTKTNFQAQAANQMTQNLINNSQRLEGILNAATTLGIDRLHNLGVDEGAALTPLAQQAMKGAQTTSPQTGQPL